MEVYYINSKNQKIFLTEKPYILLADTTIFDYLLNYSTAGKTSNKIRKFNNKMKKGKATVIVTGKTHEEYCYNINQFMDTINYDVDIEVPGKLYCGNQYCEGYFYGTENGTNYNNSKRAEIKLEFVSEKGSWITEAPYTFKSGDIATTDNKRYQYRYSYRYASGMNSLAVVNEHFAPTDFKMIIYGPCVNPHIIISGYRYQVNTLLEAGEFLTIDSKEGTVKKTMNNGTIINEFNSRNHQVSVFEKIPPGRNVVSWPGTFDFDITLFVERSQPRWD